MNCEHQQHAWHYDWVQAYRCNTLVKVQVLPIVPIVCSDDSAGSTVSCTGSERTRTDEVFEIDAVSLRVRLYQDLPTGYCSTHNTHYFFIGYPRSGCVGGLNTARGAFSGGGECTSSPSLMMLSTYNFNRTRRRAGPRPVGHFHGRWEGEVAHLWRDHPPIVFFVSRFSSSVLLLHLLAVGWRECVTDAWPTRSTCSCAEGHRDDISLK